MPKSTAAPSATRSTAETTAESPVAQAVDGTAPAFPQPSTALVELRIVNFAIIDHLDLRFHSGLNILTGETGAGKSIIIDAIGLLLGDRASSEVIRAGTERAEVEAHFHIATPPAGEIRATAEEGDGVADLVHELLLREGLDDPDAPHQLILSREVRANGRNIARVNGRSVSLHILSEIAAHLVDVHGQGEHLNLLRPRTHLHLLDRFAGLLPQRRKLASEVQRLGQVRRELDELRRSARSIAQRLDMLSFQVEEIENAQLTPQEDNDLETERQRLGNAEALLHLAQSSSTILAEGDGESPAVLDLFSEAVGRLERLARIDSSMAPVSNQSQGLLDELAALARSLQDYGENLEFNPERLLEVEERLLLIDNLKRKYGDSIPEILAFGSAAQQELATLGDWEIRTGALEKEEESLLTTIGTLGAVLSEARHKAGQTMASRVESELADLHMARARFGVSLEQREDPDGAYLPDGRRVAFDATGLDQVEFTMSANPGEPLKPMVRVASGGETARLMLALKSVLSYADATPILIFDEIDQGIGGRVGGVVGEKLWRLTGQVENPDRDVSIRHQVLCITHLPQLAAYGDCHLTVTKAIIDQEEGPRTRTVVTTLSGDAQVNELMQMLGASSAAGRQSAIEMLATVANVKRPS